MFSIIDYIITQKLNNCIKISQFCFYFWLFVFIRTYILGKHYENSWLLFSYKKTINFLYVQNIGEDYATKE